MPRRPRLKLNKFLTSGRCAGFLGLFRETMSIKTKKTKEYTREEWIDLVSKTYGDNAIASKYAKLIWEQFTFSRDSK